VLSETTASFIFDVDGTLVQSNEAHADAWSQAFLENGFDDVTAVRIRPFIGLAGPDLVRSVKPKLDEPKRSAIIAAQRRIFSADYLPHMQTSRGAHELIEQLRANRKRVAAVTSGSADEIQPLLQVVGLSGAFEVCITSDEAARPKPWPDPIREALRRFGLRPQEALSVGDSPYDIAAGHAADVPVVALLCGGWYAEQLAGADGIFEDPKDLCGALFERVSR
jgi:HAD superfamily hydrolase (TIGR01509 family)